MERLSSHNEHEQTQYQPIFTRLQIRVISLVGMIIAIAGSLWLSGSLGILHQHVAQQIERKHDPNLAANITVYTPDGLVDRYVPLSRDDMTRLQEALRIYGNVKGD